ncbi:phosphopantetheine-binding protein [Nocardia terpenica]|uniref:Acyl carrier protein n=1 Tax=Nocardia terpenica TaxID=455432 RepID=A0A164PK41_9NOCA|nr:phosphopantetheine-binding protein [Nocardia terpenica]ATL66414.1 phosphopantetheine-containing protein [Nocardia terpenica]KZM75677.1 phosphopantetheine-containing protein [Nocardia terpenica]MBF6064833.1 acyl carrier protein [Nocardia terpenica]MBF6107348.1 acyl carrier protein [Nocardia terpenica]MBF6115105.1 acyl carrier protein [Nocardia terpenica]
MTAERIVQIFSRVLQSGEVTATSDFFELGGDSLLATRVLSAIAREFGAELSFEEFAEAPSAGALSAKVASVAR